MASRHDPRGARALRLGVGTALCLAIGFGFDLPIPMVAPVLGVFLLASMNRPMPLKSGLALVLVVVFTTATGLLLSPLLRYYPMGGVLLTGLCLFLAFRWGLRGGNGLASLFLIIGLTIISAAGTIDFRLAATAVEALAKGLLVAVAVLGCCHWLFPEPANAPAPPTAPVLPVAQASRMALRATLVVLPAFLLALTDPLGYMPIILKSVSLGRQSCVTAAHGAARELLGSTLLGGLLAVAFWCALSLFVSLWMFFLWMLLFGLLAARKLYRLSSTRHPPSFWLNTLVTLVILLGQSVQDSVAGKDVYTAFAVRMGLFIAVTLYACLMLQLFEPRRRAPHPPALSEPA
ncbi:hypothetical protein AGI3411_03907 [Achromobacter agilis]|uniref:DUF2955 domain-containing protein n=2 Tax=Achromobacter agilis TaxID=1353888 RepID=A0A446CM31_9BURK|nr:hypothetical protein AGI3411_03907 [Achromobacter agilis]